MAFNQQDLWNLDLKIFDIGAKIKRLQFFLTNRKIYTVLSRNTELYKESNSEKRAYVLALGPSLKDVDLYKIKGDTIVVNRFFKIGKTYPLFVPTYYVMIDYGFVNPDNLKDFQEAIDTYADKGTIFILNAKLAGTKLVESLNPNQVYFISCIDGRMHPEKDYRIDKVFPAFQNVVGAAILALMTMGYKDINLLGCDFNSFASRTRIHCYKDKSPERPMPMYYELFAYAIAAQDHSNLAEYAKRKGYIIKNTTELSLIDAYEYVIDRSLYKE